MRRSLLHQKKRPEVGALKLCEIAWVLFAQVIDDRVEGVHVVGFEEVSF